MEKKFVKMTSKRINNDKAWLGRKLGITLLAIILVKSLMPPKKGILNTYRILSNAKSGLVIRIDILWGKKFQKSFKNKKIPLCEWLRSLLKCFCNKTMPLTEFISHASMKDLKRKWGQ